MEEHFADDDRGWDRAEEKGDDRRDDSDKYIYNVNIHMDYLLRIIL